MVKICCSVCNKYRKIKTLKYHRFIKKTLDLFWKIEKLKMISLITNIKSIRKYIIFSEQNLSQEFRLKNIDKTRNYFIE